MSTQPVFTKKPTTYSSGNEYLDVVDELLRKNRGSRNLTLYDTGSNTPNILPEAAGVRPSSISGGTNVGSEYGNPSYIPNVIQSTRTPQNQVPQTANIQNIENSERRETYQEAIDRALRIGQEMKNQGIDEEQAFSQYIEENGTSEPTGISEQDYINYFLDSRRITDPTSRNIISAILATPTSAENKQATQSAIAEIQNEPLETMSGNISKFATDLIGDRAIDPKSERYSTDVVSPIRERMRRLSMSGDTDISQEETDKMRSLYGPSKTIEEQQAEKEQKLSVLNNILSRYNSKSEDSTKAPKLEGVKKPQTNSFRQFLGDAVDILGTTLGAGESNLSEQIAGGPTINTGRKIKKNVGDFIPPMPSLVRDVQAAEITPDSKSLNNTKNLYSPNVQKAATKPPQQNIFSNIGKGIQGVGENALAEAGRGVEGLKSGLTDFIDENIFKKKDVSKMGAKNAVGEDSAQTSMEGIPGFAKTTPYSSNQDAFFKAGGAEQFKDYLSPGVNKNYRGALSTSLFTDKFFENPDNVANVFGSTSQGKEATDKYRSFMQKQYPIIPGHDSPTVKKVATGRYDDGSEWRVEYDDVDPIYYDNQYNKQVLASIPVVLTSSFKYTAPRTGAKETSGNVPRGIFEPVKGDRSVQGLKGFSVPAQATNIRTQSFPAGTSNVFSVAAQQKPYTPTSSGFSVPTKSYAQSSGGYSVPQQSRPIAPSRPNITPPPAPSKPSIPSYGTPNSTPSRPSTPAPQQSKPNAWSAPKPSYVAPSKPAPQQSRPAPQQSKPAPKPQSQNVFTNLVNTVKKWFK